MNAPQPYSPYKSVGFYQLKKIFGLGDDNVTMILELGSVRPTYFQDGNNFVPKYQICQINDALIELRGRNIKEEYTALLEQRQMEAEAATAGVDMNIVRVKFEDVQQRLAKKRRRVAQQ